eukprot:GHVR01148490.1.p1 GENE.GHVR01148490.1~~GHVR01148490.1.p1  ORF type:complete len:449 (+),score=61.26 GHVR01148490.1:188-1348(+)
MADTIQHNSKVILLMGNHEYFAATDYFHNHQYTLIDSKSFGGLQEKKKKFSNEKGYYREYVESLKIAVIVNGVFFSHSAFNKDSIKYACDIETVGVSPEGCLRKLYLKALEYLPSDNNLQQEDDPHDTIDDTSLSVYNSLSQVIPVYDDQSYFHLMCEQHKLFLKAFGASSMIIGHQPIIKDATMCDYTLFLLNGELSQWMYDEDVYEHNAYMTRLVFNSQGILTVPFKYVNVTVYHDKYIFKWDGPIFVMADAHGDYNTVFQLLKEGDIIDNELLWIAEDTLLIQLGDVIDRGPKGHYLIELFNYIRIQAEKHNSKVILLMGNHEYYAATDVFDRTVSSKIDSKCFGGLPEKKKKILKKRLLPRVRGVTEDSCDRQWSLLLSLCL